MMGARGAAWRVGAFAVAGLAALATAVVLVGGRWFAAREQAVLSFQSSVYGLNAGAPVVLRGVRVGPVVAVGLAPAGPQGLSMPVTAEFDREQLAGVLGPAAAAGPLVPQLVAQGLVGRLATQSLLTGLLYVDLDLDPARRIAGAVPAAVAGLPRIPTEATRLQTLQAQLEGLDLAQIGRDLAQIASSTRALLADAQGQKLLARAADALQSVQALARRVEAEVGPLARSTEATLAEARRQLARSGSAVDQAAIQVAAAASQVQALGGDIAPAARSLRQAGEEITRTASVLREAAAEDSALRLGSERALQDLSRAARSLRELGDLLERHPDALLRGRATP